MDSLKNDFSHCNFAESMYEHKTHAFMLLAKGAYSALCFPGFKGRGEGACVLQVGFCFVFKISLSLEKENFFENIYLWKYLKSNTEKT